MPNILQWKWERMSRNRIMRLFWDAIALNLWDVAAMARSLDRTSPWSRNPARLHYLEIL